MSEHKAMVLRWGGWGDVVMASILFPLLKEEGYYTIAHVTEKGADVIKHDPYVDEIMIHETDSIDPEGLEEFWAGIEPKYDRFINLSGSIEDNLLVSDRTEKFLYWDKETIHKNCNRNYYDETLTWAGFDPDKIEDKNPKLYFSKFEHQQARRIRKKFKNKFIILWALSGSSLHKSYPYTEYVLQKLMMEHEDIVVFFLGDTVCELIQFSHPRVKGYAGKWPIRKSLIMTEYVDLVVGPETGVLNAAAGLDVPKIIFLSHSTEENLTKYWKNTTALYSLVHCYPCHVFHQANTCPPHHKLGTPICMAELPARMVYNAIEKEYLKWTTKN